MILFRLYFTIAGLLLCMSLNAQSLIYSSAENYGGKQAFKDLIRNEMVYPEEARQMGVEGTVVLRFKVLKTGDVENVRVVEPVLSVIDREAIRLFNMLLWSPAQEKGRAVEEVKEMEFCFKLKKYKKLVRHRGYDKIVYPFQPVDSSMLIFEPSELTALPRPVYAESDMDFSSFIVQNLKYPAEAKKQGVSGAVELYFVLEPSGMVSNSKIVKGVGAGCNEEAMRLLNLLQWYPGIKDGKAVRTHMKMNISFNLENNNNMKYLPANHSIQM